MNWKTQFSARVLERGRTYYHEGHVHNIIRNKNEYLADMQGQENYHVKITMNQDGPSIMYCDCPYAKEGNTCKHMAATLFDLYGDPLNNQVLDFNASAHEEYEDEDEYEIDFDDDMDGYIEIEDEPFTYQEPFEPSLTNDEFVALLHSLNKEQLQQCLLQIVKKDTSFKETFYTAYQTLFCEEEFQDHKEVIDAIVARYVNEQDIIASKDIEAFIHELDKYLSNVISTLTAHNEPLHAYDIVNYAVQKPYTLNIFAAYQDKEAFSNYYYRLWRTIKGSCNESEKRKLRNWLLYTIDTFKLDHHLQQNIQDFLTYEFHSLEAFCEKYREMSEIIQEKSDDSDSPIEMQKHFFKKQYEFIDSMLFTDDEIDELKSSILNQELGYDIEYRMALKNNDYPHAIAALKESQPFFQCDRAKLLFVSDQLIALYEQTKQYEQLKEEIINHITNLNDFNETYVAKLKAYTTPEQYEVYHQQLLEGTRTTRYQLYLYDKNYLQLLSELNENDNFDYFMQYAKILSKECPDQLYESLKERILKMMKYSTLREQYHMLVSHLKEIAEYDNSKPFIDDILKDIYTSFPKRYALHDELKNMGL